MRLPPSILRVGSTYICASRNLIVDLLASAVGCITSMGRWGASLSWGNHGVG